MRTRILGGLVAALTALVLAAAAGCSGATPPPAGAGHGQTDVAFVTDMIPHHRGALEMAQLAPARAASPEVRGLAARIAGEQAPEIERMTAMLAAWGAPPAGAMAGMPGMDTAGLVTLSGPAFDREFLAMMTAHHAGAVTMAQAELAQGRDPQARDLASSIITAQQAEITEMQGLLGRV